MLVVTQTSKTADSKQACVQVRELLHKRVRDTFLHPQFNTDVMKPLNIESLLDQEVLISFTSAPLLPAAECCSVIWSSIARLHCRDSSFKACTFLRVLSLPGLSPSRMGAVRASDLKPIWTCVLQVRNLSGGELQRVAITLALGTPADIYLIDEPSAYLDSEQRIIAAKVRAAKRLV